MDNQITQSIISSLRSSMIENKKIGLRRITEADMDLFKDEIVLLLADPSEDIRWLTTELLCRASRKGEDISFFRKPLESLFTDEHKASWFKAGYTVGDLALSSIVYHWMNEKQWENIKQLLQSEKTKLSSILSCLRFPDMRQDMTSLLPLLDAYRMDESPEIRGLSASVLACRHYHDQKWNEIETLLEDNDYATRWYTLSALDDIAESGGDIAPLIPALVKFFNYADTELEEKRNVKYTGTLSERAAGVIVWHIIGTKPSFRSSKSFIIDGIDLKQIPEIKTIIKELRSFAKNPDK